MPRNQNSYNSGVWLDYTFQVAENQHIALLPTNDDSRTLGYDTKMLVGDSKRYPPIAWKVSKISSSLNGDKTFFTMTQEQFNPATDNEELMIANYYQSYVEPDYSDPIEESVVNNLEFVYSGLPTVRAGGGYKKFTLKEKIGDQLNDVAGKIDWTVSFEDGDLTQLEYKADSNIFKIKCKPEYSLIGKTFVITATSEHNSKSITVEVISL